VPFSTSSEPWLSFGRQALTRRRVLSRALALGSAAWVVSPLTASAKQPEAGSPAPGQPKKGGALRIGMPSDILFAGVPFLNTPGQYPLYNLVYDTLIRYDERLHPQPRLATSWTWSSDFRQLTLQLRSGVTFHTGRLFTSEDVRFNIEHLQDSTVPSQWTNYVQLMQVSTPSPDSVIISFDKPARSALDAFGLMFMADAQTVGQAGAAVQFVGTGPFRVQEWIPGDHLTVVANAGYWQPGKPYLDQVELRVLPDQQTALVTLEAGGVDWLSGVPGQDAARLQADPAYRVLLTASGGDFYYLGTNVQAPPLADKRVRQALGYALNRQRLVDVALYGFGRPASIPWPRDSLAYDGSLDQAYGYDPIHARQLLESAGWDSTTVRPISVPNGVQVALQMAQIIQADLANVGVHVAIQRLNQPEFLARFLRGQFDGAWLINMGFMNLGPATYFQTAPPVRIPNVSNFSTQEYQELISRSVAATDDELLRSDLQSLTKILLDEAFVLVIAEADGQQTGPEVARASVNGISWDRFGGFAYQDLWLP
jgi:peptide/nickel transport system substrate-binding protein